jgi:hypothetical protein
VHTDNASERTSRVVALTNKALTNKAMTLKSRRHYARAAEKLSEAVAVAQALQQPDCIIVAHLQASHADALLGHADTAGVLEARRVELLRCAYHEVLPLAMASLERRLAAGTLLAGACRPHEVAWCAAKSAHADALAANFPDAAACVPHTAEQLSSWSAYVGYDAYIITAGLALQLCADCTDVDAAQTLTLSEATAEACRVFVESAFDMIQLRTGDGSITEACLVRIAQEIMDEFRATECNQGNARARIVAAWRSLQSSGVLQRLGILEGVSFVMADHTRATATAAATAAARGLLHFCALHSCGAQEVHASQFKRCSACLSVVYCCKEHQVQDWPAHKAACRAARKAAEQPADEASGA